MKKIGLFASLAFVLSVLFGTSLTAHSASALTGTGYFSGNTGSWTSGYGGDVFPGRPNRNALQPTNYNDKRSFINFIENYYYNNPGGSRKKTGAAFIINLMTNIGYGKDRTPSASRIADWENRILDPNVNMFVVNADPNSYGRVSFWDTNINDDFFTNYNSSPRPLLVFRVDGVVRAVVEIPCGNPVGGLPGLPANWKSYANTSSAQGSVQTGGTASWSHWATLTGGRSDANINWQVLEFVKNSLSDPNPVGGVVAGGTIGAGKDPGVILSTGHSVTTNASMVGKYVCEYMRVSPRANNTGTIDNSWRASAPICIYVIPPPGPHPMVQLWGYDVGVGKRAVTSTTSSGGRTYGSWSEYGIYTGAANLGLASASAYNGGSTGSLASRNVLTFANYAAGCSSYGCYGTLPSSSTMVNALKSRCPTYGTADITISSSNALTTAPVTGTHVICTHGTVRIQANISLSDSNTTNTGNLPQVVIIANKIMIDENVSNVDSWLVAIAEDAATPGKISTCTSVVDATGNHFPRFTSISLQRSATCATPLTVTGPVITDQLYLFRTTVPGSNGTPAEIFNLRPDAFLWAYGGGSSGGNSVAQTISLKELPPRF